MHFRTRAELEQAIQSAHQLRAETLGEGVCAVLVWFVRKVLASSSAMRLTASMILLGLALASMQTTHADEEMAPLPPVEDLTIDSDFTVFMSQDVPVQLHVAALRKLWRLLGWRSDGLGDYDADYSTVVPPLRSADLHGVRRPIELCSALTDRRRLWEHCARFCRMTPGLSGDDSSGRSMCGTRTRFITVRALPRGDGLDLRAASIVPEISFGG